MEKALKDDRAALQGIYYCLHHPQAVVDDYRMSCDCRKPKPGLLVQAAKDMKLQLIGSYMVGDQPRDMTAGKSVGCTTLFVGTNLLNQQPSDADHSCEDLEAAARLIAQLESPGLVLGDPSILMGTKPGKFGKPRRADPITT
jgi:histidinol phosphatase-like enzyme